MLSGVLSGVLPNDDGDGGVRVTRIARGIPTGGEIVHMNSAVLGEALRGRRNVDSHDE